MTMTKMTTIQKSGLTQKYSWLKLFSVTSAAAFGAAASRWRSRLADVDVVLALFLCLVDAWLCLVDFDEVCVHAALYDAVINHSSVGFWNDSLILCQLPDSATFWVLIDDRRLSSIVTALGRNRCLLRGFLSTFIGWRCKENANERNESLLSNCRVLLFFCKDNTFFGCLLICRMTC